jgi:hypothetical protein
MELTRRIRWLAFAAPLALAAATTIARPAPPGVLAAPPTADRPCASNASGAQGGPRSGPAWYRLDAALDAGGTLAGQQLIAGRGATRWLASLPAESFASGPVRGRVLVGDDDGQRSRLRTLDTATGCWTVLATSPDVIRSAVLASNGTRLYEHRVDRATRRDLGVWALSVDPLAGDAELLLPGLPEDPEVGPTFITTILPVVDGRVVVSSCGERACRTRVIDPATRQVASASQTGPAVGMAGDRLIALEACDGLPCPLDVIDLASGATARLGDVSGFAVVTSDPSGAVVVADDRGLGVLRLGGSPSNRSVPGAVGLAPLRMTSTADSGVEAPSGRVAVAPGGRVDDPTAIRFLDPIALSLDAGEVFP